MNHAIPCAAGATPSTTPPAAAPRRWSLLLTSPNHGVVGAADSDFKAVPEGYERVQVMEIVEAGGAPAPGADLAGLVRIGAGDLARDDDDLLEIARTFCAIAARMGELSPEQRKHYPSPTEEGSPLLSAARAACVARGYTEDGLAIEGVTYPVAARAGQVAPADCDAAFDQWYAAQRHQLTNEQVCRLIWQRGWQAHAKAAPAAGQVAVPETIHCREFHELAMDYRAAPVFGAHQAYAAMVAHIDARLGAQASTPDGRESAS